ncbi:ATP-binding SpoIIE family protein phosphatase [Streptomyces javensis]
MEENGHTFSPRLGESGIQRRDQKLAEAALRVHERLRSSTAAAYLRTPDGSLSAAVVLDTVLSFVISPCMAEGDRRFVSALAHQSGELVCVGPDDWRRIVRETPSFVQHMPFSMRAASAPIRTARHRFGALTVRWMPDRRPSEEALDYMSNVAEEVSYSLEEMADQGVSMMAPGIPLFVPERGSGETSGASVDEAGEELPAPRAGLRSAFLFQLEKVGMELTAADRVRDVVAATRAEVVRPFGGRSVMLCLVERGRLRVAGSSGISKGDLRRVDGLTLAEGTPEGDCTLRVQPLLFATSQELRAAYPGLGRYDDGRARAFLPLVSNGRAAGCCVLVFESLRTLEQEELAILMIMLGQVGQSLERARSREIDHAVIQGMQNALLPRGLPHLKEVETTARYLPATAGTEVGGDWYDVIRLSDDEIGMIIGDVEGHSADAVGIMGQLRSGVRAYAMEGHDPANVLARSNRLLSELESDLFATCCCMWLNLETGVATVASAGHRPPLLVDSQGHAASTRLRAGPPLGIDPEAAYLETELVIPAGGIAALYTDGLLDIRGEGPETSTVRLQRDIAAHTRENLEVLADRLIDLCGTRAQREDDIALLLMRYEGTQGPHGRVAHVSVQRHDVQRVRELRHHLRDLVSDWGLAPLVEDLQLLVSEVVTNALIHAHSEVDLRIREQAGRLRVDVRDSDPHPPIPAANLELEEAGDDEAESGRGLVIVDAVASAWGSSPAGRGKTTWFELTVPEG